MSGHGIIIGEVALFLLETSLQSALLCLLVYAISRRLSLGQAALRSNLWLMAVVCPLVTPLVFHIVLPHSSLPLGWKPVEQFLTGPVAWIVAHQSLVIWISSATLLLLFALDVSRWLACVAWASRARAAGHPAVDAQAARCRALLPQVCRRLGVTPTPRLSLHQVGRAGAHTLRWPRPRICVPVHLAERLDAEELRALLAHEIAHLRRRDWLRLLVVQLCRDLTFFIPSAHLAYRQFLQATEEAADDAAAVLPQEWLALAACLVKVLARPQMPGTASAGLALAHRPADAIRRAQRLLSSESAWQSAPVCARAGWGVLAAAVLLAVII